MDLLDNVPTWDDVERNLDLKLRQLDHGVKSTWQSAQDGWIGVSRQVSEGASQVYGYVGGYRIDAIRQAMSRSYPLIESDLRRKWASINIDQILPVLLQLVKEVALILGASVAVGTAAGGAAGAFAFGVGAVPGAAAGAGIGLQIGNLILMGLGLKAIAEYFYDGLPACLSTLSSAMSTAWHAGDDFKPAGLDPTGGFAARSQAQIDRAAHQFAQGQEQLVMLLLMAIVTYLTRGQVKAGVVGSVESIAQRSAKLQAQISNKKLAAWLAQNEERLLAHPELQEHKAAAGSASEAKAALEKLEPAKPKEPVATKPPELKKAVAPPLMSLKDAVGEQAANRWIAAGRKAAESDPVRSAMLTDDQIGALHGYTLNEGYSWINPALRSQTTLTPQMEAFARHITEGLRQLPAYTAGNTFRGTTLPADVLDKIYIGGTTKDGAFMSTSAATGFMGDVQMQVTGTSGRDISFLSAFPEAEVLYPPGVQFEVLNRIQQGSTTHIAIKEIP